jgi:hypothetical protein
MRAQEALSFCEIGEWQRRRIEAGVLALQISSAMNRDKRPCINAPRAEPGVARPHDRLVTMPDVNLVEHPANMIADSLFGKSEKFRDFRVVEPFCDSFKDGAFARSQIIDRQRASLSH